ncbi:probable membrane-associated kinase regulator 4 [Lolium rigidum]|uniref:probable membrane-associated kinase regulator 4 n=1 Tax=Lolium rigidum TaxID=89674 RepID=UPI001F5DA846|nr:probable membrane-associated kinase regulator 4 [Lolium rigidum]
MASRRGEEARRDQVQEEEDYIDMDLGFAAAGREFEFHHMSAPLAGRAGEPQLPLASPADELFYKGKLLPLHLPPRAQMVEDLLLDHCAAAGVGRGRGRHLAVSTAPATPCERSRGASPANSCFVSGELNVEEFFRDYAAGLAYADDAAASAGEKQQRPWSRRLRFVTRQLNLGRQLKASRAYLKTMFAAPKPAGNADDKPGLGSKDLSSHSHGHGGHLRAWRKNPFGQVRSNRCIAADQSSGSGGGHRRSFSSVIVRYSASNKTSPAPPAPSSCSSTSSSCKSSTSTSSSVRSSSGSDGAGAPALRRSSSASSEAENPIQGLIAYCKKSQQLASVRKSASDTGFRFLSSSAASKVAAESEGLDELVEICRG